MPITPRDADGDGRIHDGTPEEGPAPGVTLRELGDARAIRTSIWERTLAATQKIPPVENSRHRLRLENPRWEGAEGYSLRDQKKAVLQGRTLGRRLRGDWVLEDKESGQELGRRTSTIANVPYLTDRGTFILNGSEYTLSHQLRLRPGIYARRKENGELEAHVNVLPGQGLSHRLELDEETGRFYVRLGQSRIPLIALLRSMGSGDRELREAWGDGVLAANREGDSPAALDKLYDRLRPRDDAGGDRRAAVARAVSSMPIDPEVSQATLGAPYDRVSREALLAATRKLLAVNRGEDPGDDRDALQYMTVYGPEDLLAERLEKSRAVLSAALWKASFKGDIGKVPPGVLDKAVRAAIMSSGLGAPGEAINPVMVFEQQTRVTRLGEGGIPSVDSVTDEARNVHPSHFGFVDPLVTPESMAVGVDSRVAQGARKGSDGRLYARFWDARARRWVWRSPQDVSGKVVAFPGELNSSKSRVAVLKNGQVDQVSRTEVDYELPSMDAAFAPVTNLVPRKSSIKPQRAVMAGRMITQALPLVEPESPLVRSGMADNPSRSYEEHIGRHMGALRAERGGVVMAAGPGAIRVRYDDGHEETHELYDNHPLNRKTSLTQTPTVTPGQRITPGQLLARSNFTDAEGVAAIGKNARVAYLPYRGHNYEDAIVVSEGFAKRMTSEQVYQHALEDDDETTRGRDAFLAVFPSKLTREQLARYDDDGVIRPGETVQPGEPLILAVRRRDRRYGVLSRGKGASFSDASITWDHHHPGVVTDAERGDKGPTVVVKSHAELEVGDKLCYSPDHEVLTRTGWKPVAEVTQTDEVASLREDGVIEYLNPVAVQAYAHKGRMYNLETTQVSLCVTENHHLYAKQRHWPKYRLVEASELVGRRFQLKRDGVWQGHDPGVVRLPGTTARDGRSGAVIRELPPLEVPARTYAMLLGAYLSRGTTFESKVGKSGFTVRQVKPKRLAELKTALDAAGIAYEETSNREVLLIVSPQWHAHVSGLGSPAERFIPDEVFAWDAETLRVLYTWLMWGRGFTGSTGHFFGALSKRLADDFQRLALLIGYSANVLDAHSYQYVLRGKPYTFQSLYRVVIFRRKNRPTINYGREGSKNKQEETWVDYDGTVHCVTLPRNHVLYVRRNGKPVWCGNSGRYGDKGVVAKIVSDEDMPHGADGRPYEVLLNPLGVISRCYDKDTEFLTHRGWKKGSEVQPEDTLGCFHAPSGRIYMMPQLEPMHRQAYNGPMLLHENKTLNFCVTPNHRFLTRHGRGETLWQVVPASRIFGKAGWELPTSGLPAPGVEEPFVLPHIDYKKRDYQSDRSERTIDAGDWAEFLGWYLAEGHLTEHGAVISQSDEVNPQKCARIATLLMRLPFRHKYSTKLKGFALYSKRLAGYLRQFGRSENKFIPDWLFRQPYQVRQRFLDAYWMGDGRTQEFATKRGRQGVHPTSAVSTSPRLVDDIQRLFVLQGKSARVGDEPMSDLGRFPVQFVSQHFRKTRVTASEAWKKIRYRGFVYCPTVPTGFVVTRRKGRVLIAGNTNPSQAIEAALGKVAEATGRPISLPDFKAIGDMTRFAREQLAQHGLQDTEDLTDPTTGRKIRRVLAGNRFIMKLHHTAESKTQARATGAYTAEGVPAKGGTGGSSKRLSLMDINALLSSGATGVVRDAGAVRGQAGPEYWARVMSGVDPAPPRTPLVFQKFLDQLQASGIRVRREGPKLRLMALTTKDVHELSGGRQLANAETVDWKSGMKPVKGGLFDPALFGGHDGNRWAAMPLHEPMPNPVMEEPIRRVLGLTEAKFRNVLTGREELAGRKGPTAIFRALDRLDLDRELEKARTEITSGRASARDAAVRKLTYLKSAKDLGLHPRDWVLDAAPILPPKFRPVSVMGAKKLPLVADANYLYRELFDANQNLREMSTRVEELGDEREAVYDAMKAVSGLGDPINPKSREKAVRGLLKQVFGPGSPKFGVVQRKLLGGSTDLVGRGVITPDPELDLDQVGLPEEQAFEAYRPFVVRRLVRRGVPRARAMAEVQDRTASARKALLEEMDERPVIYSRAPVLHRYGIMAARPVLTRGHTLRLPPLVTKGFGADFDGDQMNVHVPASDDAVQDAYEKLMPSRNLLGVSDFRSHQVPSQEFTAGLYLASTLRDDRKPERVFATRADALRAFRRRGGDLGLDDPVRVLKPD